MTAIIKAIMWVSVIIFTLILPAYLWSFLDRESYENFLLQSVSPLTKESRNSILQKRNSNSQNLKKNLNKFYK